MVPSAFSAFPFGDTYTIFSKGTDKSELFAAFTGKVAICIFDIKTTPVKIVVINFFDMIHPPFTHTKTFNTYIFSKTGIISSGAGIFIVCNPSYTFPV